MGVELDGIHHRSGLKSLWKNFVNGFKALIGQPILHDRTIPGLFPDMVNTKQGGFFSKQGGYTKNTAPFYHGMIKLRNMDARRYKRTAELWVESVEDMMKHLTSHPTNHRNLTFLAGFQDVQHIPRAELSTKSPEHPSSDKADMNDSKLLCRRHVHPRRCHPQKTTLYRLWP